MADGTVLLLTGALISIAAVRVLVREGILPKEALAAEVERSGAVFRSGELKQMVDDARSSVANMEAPTR